MLVEDEGPGPMREQWLASGSLVRTGNRRRPGGGEAACREGRVLRTADQDAAL